MHFFWGGDQVQFGHAGAQAGDYNLSFPFFHSLRLVSGSRWHGNCSRKEQGTWSDARKTAIPSAVGKCVSCSFFVLNSLHNASHINLIKYLYTGSWLQAMKEAGFFVPESFDKLPDMINQDSDYCSIDSSNSLHHFWVNSGDIQVTVSHQSETFDISMCRFTLSWSWKVRLLRHQKGETPQAPLLKTSPTVCDSTQLYHISACWDLNETNSQRDWHWTCLPTAWTLLVEEPSRKATKCWAQAAVSPKWRWCMYRDRCQWTTPGQRSWAWSGELLDLSLTRYATAPILNGSDRSRVQEAC